VSKIDISVKYHMMCLCMAAAYLNSKQKSSPKGMGFKP
jgi:hypothetical protein